VRWEKDSNSKNAGREGEEGEERGNNKSELGLKRILLMVEVGTPSKKLTLIVRKN